MSDKALENLEGDLMSLGWSKSEIDTLQMALNEGVRPISASLASQMYNLFEAGYSAQEIADRNPPFELKDVLYVRWKRQWDTKVLEKMNSLLQRVHHKSKMVRLQAVEYLFNHMEVLHKRYGDLMIKYLQTGREEDLPNLPSLKMYKDIVEVLQKLTGEDRKLQIKGDIQYINKSQSEAVEGVTQSDFLAWLASNNKNKGE